MSLQQQFCIELASQKIYSFPITTPFNIIIHFAVSNTLDHRIFPVELSIPVMQEILDEPSNVVEIYSNIGAVLDGLANLKLSPSILVVAYNQELARHIMTNTLQHNRSRQRIVAGSIILRGLYPQFDMEHFASYFKSISNLIFEYSELQRLQVWDQVERVTVNINHGIELMFICNRIAENGRSGLLTRRLPQLIIKIDDNEVSLKNIPMEHFALIRDILQKHVQTVILMGNRPLRNIINFLVLAAILVNTNTVVIPCLYPIGQVIVPRLDALPSITSILHHKVEHQKFQLQLLVNYYKTDSTARKELLQFMFSCIDNEKTQNTN